MKKLVIITCILSLVNCIFDLIRFEAAIRKKQATGSQPKHCPVCGGQAVVKRDKLKPLCKNQKIENPFCAWVECECCKTQSSCCVATSKKEAENEAIGEWNREIGIWYAERGKGYDA